MSNELQYGQPVLVFGGYEPAYLARFWRECCLPDRVWRVWVIVFEQRDSPYPKSPYPKLVRRDRVVVCPVPDDLEDMPAWTRCDAAGTG